MWELAPSLAYTDVASLISRSESYAIHQYDLLNTPELFGGIFRQRIMPGALVRASEYISTPCASERALSVRWPM